MPVDMSRYPADWKAISLAVKEAAGWKCEFCQAPHGEIVTRVPGGYWSTKPAWSDESRVWHTRNGVVYSLGLMALENNWQIEYGPEGQCLPVCRIWNSKVVLTTAHLGENRHDKMDCSNLKALCQSCHLSADHADHIAHARETRMKRRAAGSLFDTEGSSL